ncbi:MAG: hypothetical protein LBM23_07540 [Propionibacteriaceae bacterium]|jgi:uncharacterized small protein (DUF1192 family)|nr:hypothetical protein [Propionibacteriaceae bacterium]
MSAPWPPGSIDQPGSPQEYLAYLDDFGQWVADLRQQIDTIDAELLKRGLSEEATADVAVALTIWQTVKNRYDDLVRTWDSGRVGPTELDRLTRLIWGRLGDEANPGDALATRHLALNLPEACRLAEALTSQLVDDYDLTPVTREMSARLEALRAQVERLREQVALEPAADQPRLIAVVDQMDADVDALVAKADRGGDIGGSLGPLEIQGATMERDLIVGNAQRRALSGRLTTVTAQRNSVQRREAEVVALVAEVAAEVSPPPKYAVPRVEALGEIPTTPEALDRYEAQLIRASAALDYVERANREALAVKSDLADRVADLRASGDASITALVDQAGDLVAQSPAPIEVIKPLVAACEAAHAIAVASAETSETPPQESA